MGRVQKKRRKKKKNKKSYKKLFLWLIMTLLLAVIMAVIYGTVEYYFGTSPLIFGLYFDWQKFIIIFAVGIWTALSLIIFKGLK